MRVFYLILIMIVILSCSRKDDDKRIDFSDFPKEVRLNHNTVNTPPVLFSIVGMAMLDSVMVTVDLQADTFFRVFKLPDLSYVKGFVARGDGPGKELQVYPYLQPLSENQFLFQTMGSIKIAVFDLNVKEMKLVSVINLPSELMDFYPGIILNDKLIGCDMNNQSDREFTGYNPQTKKTFDFGPEFPIIDKNIPAFRRNIIFAKVLSKKPDNRYFASVYDKFPILRIYTKEGVLEKEIYYENGQQFPNALVTEEPKESQILSIMQNYRMLQSTNTFIYALYIGKTNEEIGNIGGSLNDFSKEIHVWDWNGNPIQKIILDKEIFTFCVSPDDSFIICSSLNKLDGFYKYRLIN